MPEIVPPKYQGFEPDAGHRGVIDDPDGFVNVRSGKRLDAPVIAKAKAGEPFLFEREPGDEWCKVKLASGPTGWMHYSRIKLFFTKEDLPKRGEDDEIEQQSRKHGLNYFEVVQAAARGDQKALKTFFMADADGAAEEEHVGVVCVVIHLIGDEAFAKFLRTQSHSFCKDLTIGWELGVVYPFETGDYFRQHFPKSAKLLFPGRS